MAGEGAAGTTGAMPGAGAIPAQGAAAPGAAAGDPPQQPQADTTADAQLGEAGQRALADERDARTAAEKTAKELRAQLKAIQDKDLPEAEKTARANAELKSTNETLQSENRALKAQMAVMGAASKLGFADPADAFKLVELDVDADGNPLGVEDKLKALLKAKPYLASTAARASGSADAGNNGAAASGSGTPMDMNANIRAMAGRGRGTVANG